jgi:regulator of sigma E protease
VNSALAVIFGLGIIVFFHELGHFLMAKAVGLPVERFSMGFPPILFRLKRGGTEYCIGAVPLGGFVKVDLGTSGNHGEEPATVAWWKRALVVLAGPGMNLVLAFLLILLVLGAIGTQVPDSDPVVDDPYGVPGLLRGDGIVAVNDMPVESWEQVFQETLRAPIGSFAVEREGSGMMEVPYSLTPESAPGFTPLLPTVIGEAAVGLPAYEAGLRTGDSIVSAGGVSLSAFSDLQSRVAGFQGRYLEVVFIRGGNTDTIFVEPMDYQGRKLIGVTPLTRTRTVTLPPGRALAVAATATVEGAGAFFTGILALILRPVQLVRMSGGPVFVAETLGQQAAFGLARLLETISYLSLAIMGFNLLPVPLLDGGQFLILFYEGARGRPASKKHIQIAQQVGFFLLLLLFVAVIWRDVARVVTRV